MHFSCDFCKQLNAILITIKYDLQSYSWYYDIIRKDMISVKFFVKASKNKKIQQKYKTHSKTEGGLTGPQFLQGFFWEWGSNLFQGAEVFA